MAYKIKYDEEADILTVVVVEKEIFHTQKK